VVKFYRNNVFTLNDGPARAIDDPANQDFMDAVARWVFLPLFFTRYALRVGVVGRWSPGQWAPAANGRVGLLTRRALLAVSGALQWAAEQAGVRQACMSAGNQGAIPQQAEGAQMPPTHSCRPRPARGPQAPRFAP
jgi:hypothetical protein